jgi:hypothetical protein
MGYIMALAGVVIIAGFNLSYVWQPDIVTYTGSSCTIKLIGRKTFGLTYDEIRSVKMLGEELLITIDSDKTFSLSRKRYHNDSLVRLMELLENRSAG